MSTSKKGFASMDPEKRRAIAAMGGRATKPENRSFSKNRELAAEAGRKGGKAVPAASRTFSNVRIAKEAGRKGGSATQGKRHP